MPVIISVDHHLQKTSAIATSEITLAEIRSHLGEEGERCGLGYRELIDASQATADLSSEDVRQIVTMLKDLGLKGRLGPTAVIVSNDLAYGMCRMLGVLVDDVCEVRVFRTTERERAEEWLASASIATPRQSVEAQDA